MEEYECFQLYNKTLTLLKDIYIRDEQIIGLLLDPKPNREEAYPLFRQFWAQYFIAGVPRPVRTLSNAVREQGISNNN